MNPLKLKRAVLKEELCALTGDPIAAIVLQQFLYWSERTKDVDKFIAEERTRNPDTDIEPLHGWIYKSSDELADELMGLTSASTLRRRIIELVKNGWLDERKNPKYAWDRTLQYRPNIQKIQLDLFRMGYVLSDYPLQFSFDETQMHSDDTILHSEESNLQSAGALPEITTETTPNTKEHVANATTVPATFQEWQTRIKDSKNKAAELRFMIETLYPGLEPPPFSYIGKVARKLHAGRMADLLWQTATHPPTGDLLAYIQRISSNRKAKHYDTAPDPNEPVTVNDLSKLGL